MPWLKKLWNMITKSKTSFFLALGVFCALLFLFIYLVMHNLGSNDDFKNKRFIIARDANLYPISLMGKEKNLSAFINELIFKVAIDSNLKVQMTNVPFNRLLDMLETNEVDAILSTMGPTAINRPSYLFSVPIFETGPVLVVGEKSNFRSLDDLKGKNIGIRRGDSMLIDSAGQGLSFVHFDSYLESLEDLERGRIEAVLMPGTSAYTFTQVFYPGKLRVITRPLREEGLRLVAVKSLSNHYLIETFNKGLKASFEDGSYNTMLVKWGLVNPRALQPIIQEEKKE